jgi:hypothetical protein
MKLIRPQKLEGQGHPFVFHITQREKDLLLATLKLYPMLRAGYHRLSKNSKTASQAEQDWLEESMEQLRQDHKKKLAQLFGNNQRFFKESHGDLRFSLTPEQMEWVLRVLNEVRVGSWVRLGRPELDAARKAQLSSAQSRLFTAMELSGYFEANLLEAFS